MRTCWDGCVVQTGPSGPPGGAEEDQAPSLDVVFIQTLSADDPLRETRWLTRADPG